MYIKIFYFITSDIILISQVLYLIWNLSQFHLIINGVLYLSSSLLIFISNCKCVKSEYFKVLTLFSIICKAGAIWLVSQQIQSQFQMANLILEVIFQALISSFQYKSHWEVFVAIFFWELLNIFNFNTIVQEDIVLLLLNAFLVMIKIVLVIFRKQYPQQTETKESTSKLIESAKHSDLTHKQKHNFTEITLFKEEQQCELMEIYRNQKILILNNQLQLEHLNFQMNSFLGNEMLNQTEILKLFLDLDVRLNKDMTNTSVRQLLEQVRDVNQQYTVAKLRKTRRFEVRNIILNIFPYKQNQTNQIWIHFLKFTKNPKQSTHKYLSTFRDIYSGISQSISSQIDYMATIPDQQVMKNIHTLDLLNQSLSSLVMIHLQKFSLKVEDFDMMQEFNFVESLLQDEILHKSIQINHQHIQTTSLTSDKLKFRQVYFLILYSVLKYMENAQIEIIIDQNLSFYTISIIHLTTDQINIQRIQSNNCIKIADQLIQESNQQGIPIKFGEQGIDISYIIKNQKIDILCQEQNQEYAFKSQNQVIKIVSGNSYTEYIPTPDQLELQIKRHIKKTCRNDQIFTIPQIPSIQPKFQDDMIQYSLGSTCCARVLIVGDTYCDTQTLKTILSQYKTISDQAHNKQSAFYKIHNKPKCKTCKNMDYQIIFLDPLAQGVEIIEEIRSQIELKNMRKTWCIGVSGFNDLQIKLQVYNFGLDFYLTKPILRDQLDGVIKKMFSFEFDQ